MNSTTQVETAELRRWIADQLARGCRLPDLLTAMRASGWDEALASRVLSRYGAAEVPAQPPASAIERGGALPGPDIDADTTTIEIEGHPIRILQRLDKPNLLVFGGLLADDECEALMAQSRARLSRSETVETDSGGTEVNVARTSDGMFFARAESPVIARVERRIAALLRWPESWGEGLQILRYRPGAEYKPHHDYFDPRHAGTSALLMRGGQRVATLVAYLNTPGRGGATVFPDVSFEVAAIRGNAVFFSYDRPDPQTLTLHGGAPVIEGEKWVATKWMREREFN